MTWFSHSVVTFSTMFVLTHNVFIAGCATLGCTFPDRVEGPLWQLWHRSYSHWFVLYVAAMAVLWTPETLTVNSMQLWEKGTARMMRIFLFWFSSGAVLHILEDAICGPVPVLYPTKRKRVLPQLFSVGSPGEVVFVIGYCALLYGVDRWIR